MIYLDRGGKGIDISDDELESLFSDALQRALRIRKGSGPVLILPPDLTRFHSRAGFLTDVACRVLGGIDFAIMPALGTHMVMTGAEIRRMFPGSPPEKFFVHDWRNDVAELGRLEADWVEKVSEGAVRYDWPVQVNKRLLNGGCSLIVSIGQVVPHEVIGMANYAKNLFVGCGGKEAIDKSHFLGAAYGMERMMGRVNTPVRALFDEGLRRFGDKLPPVIWALTVVGVRGGEETAADGKAAPSSPTAVRGIFCGDDRECFEKAANLAREVNVDILDEPIKKAVVYLEPEEFRTTWLGNKAIYRTRMAMADGGELLILAPGLERFGEDMGVDSLIRKYGYRPSKVIREIAGKEKDLAENLSAASHLIHGSSEGRFTIRYCPGPGLSRAEVEPAGFEWGSLDQAMSRYDIKKLRLGWNTHADGERFFYVPNPALGLWAERKRFLDG
ncbi:MAG: lactate racemase domain-containing protein [Treponema sp.]|jgi:nickel-dependent lactate racemase|nr:lactate racemase domain-containing protein [Treponema sp.]